MAYRNDLMDEYMGVVLMRPCVLSYVLFRRTVKEELPKPDSEFIMSSILQSTNDKERPPATADVALTASQESQVTDVAASPTERSDDICAKRTCADTIKRSCVQVQADDKKRKMTEQEGADNIDYVDWSDDKPKKARRPTFI